MEGNSLVKSFALGEYFERLVLKTILSLLVELNWRRRGRSDLYILRVSYMYRFPGPCVRHKLTRVVTVLNRMSFAWLPGCLDGLPNCPSQSFSDEGIGVSVHCPWKRRANGCWNKEAFTVGPGGRLVADISDEASARRVSPERV